MNRSKRIYIMLSVLAGACILTLGVLRLEKHQEKIQNSDAVVLQVDTDALKSLSWEYEDQSISLHKEDRWIYDEDEVFPVDNDEIDRMVEQFQDFDVSFIIEDVEDYGQYGLDDPICTINMSTESEDYQILLGDYSEMDSQRYISLGDGNAYLVQHDPLEEFDAVLNELLLDDEIPDFEQVQKITLTGEETLTITYEEDSENTYREEDVFFTQSNGKQVPLDTLKVESYLYDVEQLFFNNYVTYNATETELEECGLIDPDLTISIDYTWVDEAEQEQSGTFALSIAQDPAEKEAAEAMKEENGEDDSADPEEKITAYARVGDSKIIYQISELDYETLMLASYNDLRHQEVIPADATDIQQLDISLEGQNYTITSDKKDEMRVFFYEDEELESDSIRLALSGLKADSFTEEAPTQKKEIGLTVYLDLEDQPIINIDFYRYDGSNCLAVVDGKSVSLVPRAAVVDLIEAVNEIVLE